jgi:hypothetical protein
MPADSSVLTIAGITHVISTPVPCSSSSSEAHRPTTACLLAQ